MHSLRSVLALAVAAALFAAPVLAQDAAQGQQVFRLCAACHTGAPDALGPNLHGVMGRAAGSLADFHYSGPMKRSGVIWTPEALQRFLTDPQGTIPGNRMPLAQLAPIDAAAVIKYLATLN